MAETLGLGGYGRGVERFEVVEQPEDRALGQARAFGDLGRAGQRGRSGLEQVEHGLDRRQATPFGARPTAVEIRRR